MGSQEYSEEFLGKVLGYFKDHTEALMELKRVLNKVLTDHKTEHGTTAGVLDKIETELHNREKEHERTETQLGGLTSSIGELSIKISEQILSAGLATKTIEDAIKDAEDAIEKVPIDIKPEVGVLEEIKEINTKLEGINSWGKVKLPIVSAIISIILWFVTVLVSFPFATNYIESLVEKEAIHDLVENAMKELPHIIEEVAEDKPSTK